MIAANRPPPPLRNRFYQAAAVIAVIIIGLVWRSGFVTLSTFQSKYGGDALWALMVFFGLGMILNRVKTWSLAIIAVVCAWGVEFSQLLHAPWLDAFRATRFGHLVLGSTFNWPDLPAYALGIGIGVWIELAWRSRRRS